MKITKISIPADSDIGIGPITMNKLGQCVLVAGKNGSGKSRLINKIKTTLGSKPRQQQMKDWKQNLEQRKKDLGVHTAEIKRLSEHLKSSSDSQLQFAEALQQQKTYFKSAKDNIKELEELLAWNLIETSEVLNKYNYIDYVPIVNRHAILTHL